MHPIFRSPRRFAIYLLAWTPLAALLPYVLAKANGLRAGEAALLVIPLALIYAIMCLGAWYPCRFTPLRTAGFTRVASTHLIAAVVISYLWVLIAQAHAAVLGLGPRLVQYYPLFGAGVLLYLLAVGLFYVLLALEGWRQAEKREMEARLLARDAELRALKAQVNPHFLFNSLHSISALTSLDAARAREMCVTLADFLRRTLGLGEKASIPLDEELALVHRFLAVEKIRFGARLTLEEEVAPDTLACLVPPLLLQPLVENAVWHGIANLPDGGWVRLRCSKKEQLLSVQLENSFDPDTPTRRNGVGLNNVRRRLETRYGCEATLIATADGDCFRVALSLPAETVSAPPSAALSESAKGKS